MDHQPSNRRERKAEVRRLQIMEAAAGLFVEKGYHRTTTRDIAQAADVAEGTIYNYFQNKEDLLSAILRYLMDFEAMLSQMDMALEIDMRQFMILQFKERIERLGTTAENFLLAVFPEIISTPALREMFYTQTLLPLLKNYEEHFQKRIHREQIRPLNVEILARMLFALAFGYASLATLGDPLIKEAWENAPDAMAEEMSSILIDGLRKNAE